MQVSNFNDQIIMTKIGEMQKLTEEAEELRKRTDVKKVIVAALPRLGDPVNINGLLFRVKAEYSRNRFMIQLIEPD